MSKISYIKNNILVDFLKFLHPFGSPENLALTSFHDWPEAGTQFTRFNYAPVILLCTFAQYLISLLSKVTIFLINSNWKKMSSDMCNTW